MSKLYDLHDIARMGVEIAEIVSDLDGTPVVIAEKREIEIFYDRSTITDETVKALVTAGDFEDSDNLLVLDAKDAAKLVALISSHLVKET